jgi:hypothetical protein
MHVASPLARSAAVLVTLTVAVFSPTLSASFVYDARLQILTDPFLHDPSNWPDVLTFRVLARDVLDFNRPVHLASLMLDAAVWGRDPFGYHLTSVLLHAANVVLVWRLAVRATTMRGTEESGFERRFAEMLPAVLFAVHPVVTEAVCEPTFREDLLATAFSLGAVILATGSAGAIPAALRVAGVVGCCLFAVASKETGVAAPVLVAVACWSLPRDRVPWKSMPAAIIGGAVVVVAFLAARFLLEPFPSTIFESKPEYPGGSLGAAMAIEPRILALYAQVILLPVNQAADYGLLSVRHLPLAVAIPIVAAIGVVAVLAIRVDRRSALAVAMVVVPLVPVSNLVPIYRAAADRYLYFPLAGLAIGLAILLDSQWLARRRAVRQRVLLAGAGVAVVMGFACLERQKVWASSLALWQDAFRKNPASYTAASGLGDALREVGRLPEAEAATRDAIRLSGGRKGDPWVNLALTLDAMGRAGESREAVARAVEIDPRLRDPASRVRSLAMERSVADAWARLLEKSPVP